MLQLSGLISLGSNALTQGAEYEDEEQGEDMCPCVIAALLSRRSASWFLIAILPPLQLCM